MAIQDFELGDGWVMGKVYDVAKASPANTTDLHDKMHGYLLKHRRATLRAALPTISGGETIAVHVWTEGSNGG